MANLLFSIFPSCKLDEKKFLGSFKHSYIKYKITVSLYSEEKAGEVTHWLSYEELLSAPISSMIKKALKFIDNDY